MDKFTEIYRAGSTARYHAEHKILTQEVGAHTWGVVSLLLMFHPDPSMALIRCAQFHDCGERRGPGDVRYHAKRDNEELREASHAVELTEMHRLGLGELQSQLTQEEEDWLKWADIAECGMHAAQLWQACAYPCCLPVVQEASNALEQAKFTVLGGNTGDVKLLMHNVLRHARANGWTS